MEALICISGVESLSVSGSTPGCIYCIAAVCFNLLKYPETFFLQGSLASIARFVRLFAEHCCAAEFVLESRQS
jgi:hypothetical protein